MADQFIQIGTGHGGGGITPLEQAANLMSPGTNAEYTPGFVDVNLSPGTGATMSVAHWNMKGHYNHARKEIQILGKNANTGSGNGEIGHFMFDLTTDGPWRVIRRWGVGTTGHVYDSHCVEPETGDQYYCQWSDEFLQRYNRASDTWISNTASAGVEWGASPPHANIEWLTDLFGPGDGGVICLIRQLSGGSIRMFFFRKSTGAWSNANAGGGFASGPQQDGGSIYAPALNAVIIGGGQDSNRMFKVTSGPTIAEVAAVPIPMGAHNEGNSPLSLHPDGYPMLLEQTLDASSNRVWVFNGTSWVQQSYTHPFNAVPSSSGADKAWTTVPCPEIGLVLGIVVTSVADFCRMERWKPPAAEI